VSAPLVEAIRTCLKGAGYVDLATPFKVAGVEFAFTAAMRGSDGRASTLCCSSTRRRGISGIGTARAFGSVSRP
jgi:hypothetical protein